jgi:hypothetical protein
MKILLPEEINPLNTTDIIHYMDDLHLELHDDVESVFQYLDTFNAKPLFDEGSRLFLDVMYNDGLKVFSYSIEKLKNVEFHKEMTIDNKIVKLYLNKP